MPSFSDRIRSAGSQLSSMGADMLPGWLVASGVGAWLAVGIAAVIALVAWFVSASSSISIPLILALVIGMVAYPLCERMIRRGLPKSAAAAIVLVLLAAIVAGVFWVTLAGVISQWPSIQEQLQRATTRLTAELQAIGVSSDTVTAFIEKSWSDPSASDMSNPLAAGLLSSVGSFLGAGLSGTFAFLFGVFISATLLYYVLSDFPTMAHWMGSHLGLPTSIGEGIVEDAVKAMRGYFRANTISGFVVAAVIGIAMLIMGVPLAIPVALVTFLTVYIPFFGAIFSGAFAFMVALGSNGLTAAIILLAVVLIAQNVLQTVINARVMGDELDLHPLVVLVVTMLGGIFGGLLGAALGAPVAALFVSAGKRLKTAFDAGQFDGTWDGPAGEAAAEVLPE